MPIPTSTVATPSAEGSARQRVLRAALRRFATDGVVGVTLEDVRQEAGVSVGALYHHFADKEALLETLYIEITSRVQAAFLEVLRAHPAAEDGIKAVVRFYARWVARERAATTILLEHRPHSAQLQELNRRFFTEVKAWWQTHVHYGAVRQLPFDLIHALWLGPIQEYTRHWLAGHAKRSPTTAANVFAEAAWNTLKEPV